MIDLNRIPVLRVLLPFSAGSVLGLRPVIPAQFHVVLIITSILWIWLVVIFRFMRKRPVFLSGLFCLTACIFYGLAGLGTGMLVRPGDPRLPVREKVLVRGEILEDARPVNRSWMTEMRTGLVDSGDSCFVTATIVKVYLKMPPDSVLPACGETWQFCGELSAIRNSGNPGEPDYEKILQRKNCWYRFYVSDLPSLNHRVNGEEGHSKRQRVIRKALADRWEGEPEELSLLKAVCLGDRSGLTPEMEHDFSRAGGMHILAVSGLHVGLIWWVLYHALAFVSRITGREIYRTLLILAMLWTYAWITGFSSPVCRSVTMFSLLTLGKLLDQRSSTLNGILVSAFLLIVLDPGRIPDVGFQLSYAAVIGIVTLQPHLRGLFRTRYRILKWARDASGVSIAAQLATGPLVAFYFYQLPTYAILTNLVAVPLLSCIIALFVISTPFFAAGCCTWLFNWSLTRLSALLHRSMALVGSLPGSVIGNLHPDRVDVFLMLAGIILAICILHDRRNLFRYLLMVHLAVMLGRSSWSRYQAMHSSEFVAAHFYGGSLLIFREGLCVDYYIWYRDSLVADRMQRYVETSRDCRCYHSTGVHMTGLPYGEGSATACRPLCRGAWQVGNDRFRGVVICREFDPAGQPFLAEGDWDFVVLSGEPLCLSPGSTGILPRYDLIVDGSNRAWYTGQLDPNGGTLHLTAQRGAYVKRW